MNDALFEVRTHLEEEKNTSIQLENQITELQNQIEQLEQNIVEVETQRNELEEQLISASNRVKITDFSIEGTTFPPVNVGWISDFIVTVENFGINDVENLTVFFNIQYYKSYPGELINWSINIGTVKVGESITVHQWIQHDYYTNPIIATLMKDEIILDTQASTWKVI